MRKQLYNFFSDNSEGKDVTGRHQHIQPPNDGRILEGADKCSKCDSYVFHMFTGCTYKNVSIDTCSVSLVELHEAVNQREKKACGKSNFSLFLIYSDNYNCPKIIDSTLQALVF